MNMSLLLHEYSPDWAQAFMDLRGVLKAALGNLAIEIHHVGSTSIPGMLAKPILDIAVEIPQGVSIEAVSRRLPGRISNRLSHPGASRYAGERAALTAIRGWGTKCSGSILL